MRLEQKCGPQTGRRKRGLGVRLAADNPASQSYIFCFCKQGGLSMFSVCRFVRNVLAVFLIAAAGVFPAHAASESSEETFEQDSVIEEAAEFFGEGAEGVAKAIEKVFADQGKPNGYIKGRELSGALVVGARYGDGTLVLKRGVQKKVHWTGPSIGFDAGGNASKVFVLVYNLSNVDDMFQRFPAVDGSLYFIAGASVNYHQSGDIILAPIRLGVGLRTGVNVGYMHYRREKSWNPF